MSEGISSVSVLLTNVSHGVATIEIKADTNELLFATYFAVHKIMDRLSEIIEKELLEKEKS